MYPCGSGIGHLIILLVVLMDIALVAGEPLIGILLMATVGGMFFTITLAINRRRYRVSVLDFRPSKLT